MTLLRLGVCLPLLVTACMPASQANSGDAVKNARIAAGAALYETHCVSCHGVNLSGGQAPSLADDVWEFGGADADIEAIILDGNEEAGMPAYADLLTDQDVSDVITYIRNGAVLDTTPPVTTVPSSEDGVTVDTWVSGLEEPWGFTFTSENSALVTEKKGTLRRIENGDLVDAPITGIPEVRSNGQGGLLDVAIDPDYETNGWVYLTYSDPKELGAREAMTKLIRGKIRDGAWVDQEVLFEANKEHYVRSRVHYGSRITFDMAGHLYFSIGDRGKKEMAQDLTRPNGKIHRIKTDGSIPADNPFLDVEGAYKTIYSYGHRNPQGLIYHEESDQLWDTEHGPKGGDELNRIEKSKNYGWPVISYGRNYNGTVLTPFTAKDGMEQPESHWTPSIAVCGLDVYTGDLFEDWEGRLLVGSLANQSLRVVHIDDGNYMDETIILKDKGRIRDVTTGPDGAIYVALPTKIVRLTPHAN